MSGTIEIRREDDSWVIEGGSARIQITKPTEGLVERFIDDWESEQPEPPPRAGRGQSGRPRTQRR